MAKTDLEKTNAAVTPTQATPDIRTQQKAMVAQRPTAIPSRTQGTNASSASGAVNRSATKPPVPTSVAPLEQPTPPKPINITPPVVKPVPGSVKTVSGFGTPKLGSGNAVQAQAPLTKPADSNGIGVNNGYTASTGVANPTPLAARPTVGKAAFLNPTSFVSPMAQGINKGMAGGNVPAASSRKV
jgi:hypothetical protein